MRNEITIEYEYDEFIFFITFTGGKVLSLLESNKVYGIIEDITDLSIERSIEEIADYTYQLLDAQIRRTYNTQAVMLDRVKVTSTSTGVSVSAIR